MLPAQVADTARRAVSIAMEDRREAFQRAAGDVISEASKRGALYSSMTVMGVRGVAKTEYEVRAQLAWQAWLRALSTQQSVVTTDLRPFLLSEIEKALESDSRDVADKVTEVQNMMRGMGGETPEQVSAAARTRALEKVASDIDYAILEANSKHSQGAGSATFNFYGQVGAVQTGPDATAMVTITADQRQTIAGALTAVQEVVERAPELEPAQRAQVVELVTEARAEVEKDQPNGLKLRTVLGGIGMAVQTLGSAAAAYQLLKGGAALIGAHLP